MMISVNFLLADERSDSTPLVAYHDIVKDSKSKELSERLVVLNIGHHQAPLNPEYSNYSMHGVRWRRQTRGGEEPPLYQRLDFCRRVDFNVNFLELGWDKWILFPKTFNAHACTGDCSLPLQRMRKRRVQQAGVSRRGVKSQRRSSTSVATSATNHAQIMSILEFKHPGLSKQMTKCVSTKLKPLTVIFLDEQGQIKTKQYEDMIVDECGCR